MHHVLMVRKGLSLFLAECSRMSACIIYSVKRFDSSTAFTRNEKKIVYSKFGVCGFSVFIYSLIHSFFFNVCQPKVFNMYINTQWCVRHNKLNKVCCVWLTHHCMFIYSFIHSFIATANPWSTACLHQVYSNNKNLLHWGHSHTGNYLQWDGNMMTVHYIWHDTCFAHWRQLTPLIYISSIWTCYEMKRTRRRTLKDAKRRNFMVHSYFSKSGGNSAFLL